MRPAPGVRRGDVTAMTQRVHRVEESPVEVIDGAHPVHQA